MPRFISITKAALIANVQVKDIQDKISKNQLASTRGKIHIDDFIDCYPQAEVEQADMLSLVEKIKEQSFECGAAKQHGELTFAALKQELKNCRTNEKYYRERSGKYEELILHACKTLNDTEGKVINEQRIQRLKQWIEKRLVEIQRNE